MKRIGFKEAVELMENGCIIQYNTMPFHIPDVPDIGIYQPDGEIRSICGTDVLCNKLIGYITFDCYAKIYNHFNGLFKTAESNYMYDYYSIH